MSIRSPLALVLASLLMTGCEMSAAPGASTRTGGPAEWRIGFWAWEPSWSAGYASAREPLAVDDVYVEGHFGLFPRSVGDLAEWPRSLPPARRYWALWRLEGGQSPLTRPDAAEGIGGQFASLQRAGARRRIDPAGVQIDFDCPTGRLHDYAVWLALLRKHLPPGARLSITTLLDWFRPDTQIADVLAQVDEFVPQFYDARPPAGSAMTIAEPVDAARWAPVFNRFRTPYKIGISAFGRLRQGRGPLLLGPTLLEFVSSPAFEPAVASVTPAGESRLALRARAWTTVQWTRIEPGAVVEAVLPTRDSVAEAYVQARLMGGFCVGVVFFRWPTDAETLVLSPVEVFRAIGAPVTEAASDRVERVDGDCAAVRCSDLYLLPAEQYPPEARSLVVRASAELEYFLPDPKVARLVSMTKRDTVTVRLPAWHGETRLYLGRAVSKETPLFTVLGGSR
jgi:hypothetical protein